MCNNAQFIPAPAGWRVQQVEVQNWPISTAFPLAGWLMKNDGAVVPVYYDQWDAANPWMREAVVSEPNGIYHHVVGPGEELLASDEIESKLSEVENSWSFDRKLWHKLGVSFEDGIAIHHEGIKAYEAYLAVPTVERGGLSFAEWVKRDPAEYPAV